MQRTTPPTGAALAPVDPESGVLVHTRADRELAIEHWFLATHPAPEQVRAEWTQAGVALLPLGTLFSAVRIPASLVVAAVGSDKHTDVDALLEEVLDGGPVICDPRHRRYYALVPGSMPDRWHDAAEDWRPLGVECLGRGWYLGVPRLQAAELNPEAWASYWSVPMPSAAVLCQPLAVARLIAVGQRRMGQEPSEVVHA
ncbi:hypothetical protein ACQEVY_23590 [Streptomyces sp. CA-288835]|uniref:hypothetical protein n=1 Tax=Streptomyces sp. CA-288835 TaxID=3240069 RepID=UPI003D89B808